MRARSVSVATGVLVLAVIGGAMRVGATSYDPLTREEEPARRELTPGDTVFLFHSGTGDVRRSVKAGDTLGVSRLAPDGMTRPVGLIRAGAFVGEFCLKGEVAQGRIAPRDVAEKDRVYLLVVTRDLCRP